MAEQEQKFIQLVLIAGALISISVLVVHRTALPRRYVYNPPFPFRLSNIYYLNLAHRIKNREHMEQMLLSSGFATHVGYERFNAIDGTGLNLNHLVCDRKLSKAAYNDIVTNQVIGGELLTEGGLGCFMSHLQLWGEIANLEAPALILEDDVVLLPEFEVHISNVLSALPQDFGICYFASIFGRVYVRLRIRLANICIA